VNLAALAFVLVLGYAASICTPEAAEAQSEKFAFRVLVPGLSDPFEITWGPDGYLWVTERTAKRVTRVSPADGSKVPTATISEALVSERTQDGVLGMALHPELLQNTGNDYVYVAYAYDAEKDPEALDRRIKIVRYTYDAATQVLASEVNRIQAGKNYGWPHVAGYRDDQAYV
jgi:glucose/arabinose dehydrogenase